MLLSGSTMRVSVILTAALAAFAASRPSANAAPQAPPWSAAVRCALNPAHPEGLHPDALAALKALSLTHRITQGINHKVERGNVHDTDGTVNGKPYTGAADISVRCLTAAQIQQLLGRLADAGFAAWYRKDGDDGWTGPPHIHAVFAGCALKAVLRRQVESWLDGNNGLGGNTPYKFWKPAAAMKDKVRTAYRKFNGVN